MQKLSIPKFDFFKNDINPENLREHHNATAFNGVTTLTGKAKSAIICIDKILN